MDSVHDSDTTIGNQSGAPAKKILPSSGPKRERPPARDLRNKQEVAPKYNKLDRGRPEITPAADSQYKHDYSDVSDVEPAFRRSTVKNAYTGNVNNYNGYRKNILPSAAVNNRATGHHLGNMSP